MNGKRAAVIILGAEVAMAASFALAGMAGLSGHAQADSGTVNLSDAPWIDALPTCQQEDCSDVPAQLGVWTDSDTGAAWLSLGDHSLLVIDDTAVMLGEEG